MTTPTPKKNISIEALNKAFLTKEAIASCSLDRETQCGDMTIEPKQTPTQIATESMKGCGKEFGDEEICGCYIKWGNKVHLCPSCEKVNQTHKQDWEGELEYQKLVQNDILCLRIKGDLITSKRIIELTQALKILNTKEAGK